MFVGIALLVFMGRTNKVEILAPGMAGFLSHSGLTGACTAGDLGDVSKERSPIMINIPFFGHIFVFTILAASAARDELYVVPGLLVVLVGVVLTYYALKTLRASQGGEVGDSGNILALRGHAVEIAVFENGLGLKNTQFTEYDHRIYRKQ